MTRVFSPYSHVRSQNAFLIKQGSGRLQFSREKGNLLNKNSFRCSGLANSKTVHIGTPVGLDTPFAVKRGGKFQNGTLKCKVSAISAVLFFAFSCSWLNPVLFLKYFPFICVFVAFTSCDAFSSPPKA